MTRDEKPVARVANHDDAWIAAAASALEPRPMDADRARAFRLAISRRIERPRRPGWRAGLALAATAGLAVGLWIERRTTPSDARPAVEVVRHVPAPPAERRIALHEPRPLADVAPLWDGTLENLEDLDEPLAPREYLPADYVVLASFVASE